jgi:AcrR family transcriptional regulator
MKSSAIYTTPLVEPTQKRAKETYRSLLRAAQEIIAEDGFEALNSNAIVDRAGLTPPAFYRYFENKHSILAVLGRQLMDAQNAIVGELLSRDGWTGKRALEETRSLVRGTLKVTEGFKGGYALMVSLRAIPALREIRLSSHSHVAAQMTERYLEIDRNADRAEIYDRFRLASEIGYASVEMLLETDECDRERIIGRTAEAIRAVLTP